MIWFSASCSFTILPNSFGLPALPLRMTSVDGSNRLSSLPSLRVLPRKIGDAFVEQPGVQLVKVLEPQPWREEALAHEGDLVLDLTLLPAGRGRARDRLDQVVAAHL